MSFIHSARNQFQFYKSLGEKTIAQLDDDQLFWQYNNESNSIAVIIHHLSGNMKSRWTDFLHSDGEKPWRNRDHEFEDVLQERSEIMSAWNEGWETLFNALDEINEHNLDQIIYIRNQEHSIIEAIHRQLPHYAYHVGQIVYLGKMLLNSNWNTLSVAKGKSKEFNDQKFSKGKHGGHFTDDFK